MKYINNPSVNVSEHLVAGENMVEVQVTTSLKNRMIDLEIFPGFGPPPESSAYGLTGEATLVTFEKLEIPANVNDDQDDQDRKDGQDDQDGDEDQDNEDGESGQDKGSNNELPNTASPIFNFLLIGFLLLVTGVTFVFIQTRRA